MKKLITLIVFLFAINTVFAQNMVPNGSFESYTTCPTTYGAIANSTGWGQYIASPDYFNSCAGTALTSTPNNNWGWQVPASGNAYAGIVVFPNQTTREALGRNIVPLTVGVRYEVSMSVSLANYAKYGIDGLGAHFILNSTTAGSYTTAATIIPQVSYSGYGPISDTASWVRLVGAFVADSAYNYIAITGWGPYSSFDVDTVNPAGTFYAYYYIDSVVVRPITGIINLYADSVLCAGDTINVPYGLYRTYNSGNVFSVQLSNAAGSFATGTTTIGTSTNSSGNITCVIPRNIAASNTYRLRILATSPTDTSDDNGINIRIKPLPTAVVASSNAPLCATDTLRLSGSSGNTDVTYSWIGVAGFAAGVKDTFRAATTTAHTGNYILTVNRQGCIVKDTTYVLVKPRPDTPHASSNSPVCTGASISFTGTNNTPGVSYMWNGPSGFSSTSQSPVRTGAVTAYSGIYRVYTSLNGCASLMYDSTAVFVYPVTPSPVPSANTPLCLGQDLQLGAGTIPGASYVWSGPGGYGSTLQNPLRTASTSAFAGKYYVQAIVNGCISSADSVTVAVNPTPTISMYPSPKDSICVGQNVTFVSSNSNAGSSYTRSWFKNNNVIGGAANANYSTTTAADGDEYYVTLTAYGVCATPYTDTSNVIKMRVLPYLAPSVSISANPNTTVTSGTMINFTATPTNGGNMSKYQWTRNGTNITGAISNIWGASTLSNNDQICVDMTSGYLCPNPKTAKSNCIKVSIESTGIVGVWTGKEPSIYPNPTNDKLTIEGIDKGTKIQLSDVLGRVVIKATATNETTELNMSHLAAGSYMLILSKDNGDRMSVKVVKE
ncbi:MAG: T9SS type A sorting domain-containing protein [Flavipsychrobacter sp.]